MKLFKKISPFIVVGVSVLAFILLAINPAAKLAQTGIAVDRSGFNYIFKGGVKDGKEAVSGLGLVAFLLFFVVIILMSIRQLDRNLRYWISGALLILMAIFLFAAPSSINGNLKPAAGLIVPGVFFLLDGVYAIIIGVLDKVGVLKE